MNYSDFDIELSAYGKEDGVESFTVRVIDSPAGRQRSSEATKMTVDPGLRERLNRLDRRELDSEGMAALGLELSILLFPPPAKRLFEDSLLKLHDDERLRLRLRLESPALARLPWELVGVPPRDDDDRGPDGAGPVALQNRLSVVRHEVTDQPEPRFRSLGKEASIRLAALLSNPATADFQALDLDEEERRLLDGTRQIGNLQVDVARDGGVDALERLTADSLHVFHFAGHGQFVEEMAAEFGEVEGRGTLILGAGAGEVLRLPADRLSRNLRQRGVRLVVLSACEGATRDSIQAWSGIAPALVRDGIPIVVAMQFTIADESAIQFTESFYRTLALGQPVDAAVTNGRQAIANAAGEGNRDWAAPVLYLSGADVPFPVSRLPGRRYYANVALLTGAAILLSTWVWQHLFHMLPVARLVGLLTGAALLVSALAVVVRFALRLTRRATERAESRLEAQLERRSTTWVSSAIFAVSVVLYFATTSIFLLYEPGGSTDGPVVVDVRREDGSRFARLSVGPERVSTGRLALFDMRRTFTLDVADPAWLDATSMTLHPLWPTAHVKTSDLAARDVVVLRILPALGMLPRLPESGAAEPLRRFDLEIRTRGRTTVIRDVRREALLVGPDSSYVERQLADEGGQVREAAFRANLTGMPGGTVDDWVDRWSRGAVVPLIPPLVAGDTVVVELSTDPESRVIGRDTVVLRVDRVGQIQNHFFDALPGG